MCGGGGRCGCVWWGVDVGVWWWGVDVGVWWGGRCVCGGGWG